MYLFFRAYSWSAALEDQYDPASLQHIWRKILPYPEPKIKMPEWEFSFQYDSIDHSCYVATFQDDDDNSEMDIFLLWAA